MDLIREQNNVDILFEPGVFYKPLAPNVITPKPQDQFTREMAFYILEKMGYVKINEKTKEQVYKIDEVVGKAKTLADLINAY